MFGKGSARVIITGFRPAASTIAGTREPRQCGDLMVLGQTVRLWRPLDDRPFLKRENLKRGTIQNICDTKIHFVETKKSYDFFAGNEIAVTLTDEDAGRTAISPESEQSNRPALENDRSDDLTGKDLLQLMGPQWLSGSSMEPIRDPGDYAFDEQDLKDGAYFMLRTNVKAPLVADRNANTATAAMPDALSKSTQQELHLFAGTLGRIERRAGFRSEPLWVVDVLPDSAPGPRWRSLLSLPRGFNEHALPRRVILSSNQIVEINHFFDQYGVEWTRFAQESAEKNGGGEDPGTTLLPEIYAPPATPLAENVAAAKRDQVLEAVKQTALGLVLIFRDSEALSRRETLVLEESTGGSHGTTAPDLLRRQCFLGLDRLENSPSRVTQDSASPAFVVTGVDVKVFRPKSSARVPPSYYAVDLELLLSPNFSSSAVPLVCRFPSVPIDTAIVGMAERILSSRLEIRKEKER